MTVEVLNPSPLLLVIQLFRQEISLGKFKIRSRAGKLIALKENAIQTEILDAMEAQARAGMPVRIIIPKARKLGVSTLIVAFLRFLAIILPTWHSYVAAHTADATHDIFEIAKLAEEHESHGAVRKGTAKRLLYPHEDGRSRFVCATAGGHYVGSGSTLNALHLSEGPKWQGSAKTITGQMLSLLNSVPDDPSSCIFIEATANQADESGDFEARCWAANRGESDYTLVFLPWFREPTYTRRGDPIDDPTAYEVWLRSEFGLSDAQLRWRRATIINKCRGSEVLFMQEYPATLEECFVQPEGRIFPMLRRDVYHRHIADCGEWDCYRGVDWGGTHEFVCVWFAHNRSAPPGFTVDVEQCPLVWDGLTRWVWDESVVPRKPMERFKDRADPVRYAVTGFDMTGHVHIYRELVVANSARQGKSELDLAEDVKRMTHEPIIATIADRSRPQAIVLFCQRGVPTIAYQRPDTTKLGEIKDGIGYLHGLMIATTPFTIAPPERSLVQRMMDMQDDSSFPFVVGGDLALEIQQARRVQSDSGHPFLGDCY